MVLQPVIETPVHDTKEHENVTDLSSVAVWNQEKEELTIFAVNRNTKEDMELITDLRSLEGYHLEEHIVLESNDMKICNSAGEELVMPKPVQRSTMEDGKMTSMLTKASIPAYDGIVLRHSDTLAGLKDAEEVRVWQKHDKGIMTGKELVFG